MKRKTIIMAIVTVVLAIAGAFFGVTYTEEDIKEISEGVETVVSIIDQSTVEIPEAYIEDEERLEEQEVEDESFELQGEIAYNGTSELPKVELGDYAGLTYYSQIDSRWKNVMYSSINSSNQTIGTSGCAPTCGAMIVSSIKGNITPKTMADLYVKYGYRSANNGTYWSAFRFTADVFDIGYNEVYKLDEAIKLLNENYMLVVACGNGLFTTGGHFIVVYGIDGDSLKIYDPYLYSGKFNTSTRRGKAQVEGNTVYVEKETFRAYANYSGFFAFKNDNKTVVSNTTKTEIKTSTYTRYVKVKTSLNVRSGAGMKYKIVGTKKNGSKVTVYEEKGNWSRIGTNKWVYSTYLTDSNITNTVGQYKRLKKTYTYIYSKSNLSGTKYTYLANTKVKIVKNISTKIDKIYVPATGRCGYVSISAYK